MKSHIKFHCQRRLSRSPTECTPWTTEATTQGTSILSIDVPHHRLLLPNVYESKAPLENKIGIISTHKLKNTRIKRTDILGRRAPSVLKYNGTYKSDNLKQPRELRTPISVTARDLNANYNTKFSRDDVSCYRHHFYSKVYNTILQKNITSSVHDDVQDSEQMDAFQNSLLEVSSRQGHMCLYCGKFYSRKYGLKIHLRTHTGYKPLKCKICKRPFGDPSNLNKHVRLHADGDTPYKCKFCGKVLVRRRDLARHYKSRHQNLLSKCS